tara:strand:+ start:52 stop:951 length:900 start_codon:yes stop_codon:yes gene_type:complete
MNDMVTINTDNYAAMAKAMGIAEEKPKTSNSLPRLTINRDAIMGDEEVKGKMTKVELVKGGNFKLFLPEENVTYYGEDIVIRPFMQRFNFKRFIPNHNPKQGEKRGSYMKTIMADTLNIDLKDNHGSFNCGKPSGYIKDFQSLPEDMKKLLTSIKRVRAIFGEVTFGKTYDMEGKEVSETITSKPFLWEVDNRDAFKLMGEPFSKLAQMKRLPVQHTMTISTEVRPMNNGGVYYIPKPNLNLKDTIQVSESDQETFSNFIAWIENYNGYITNLWDEKNRNKVSEDDMKVVDEFVEVDNG